MLSFVNLLEGDRFYFPNDKKKTVYEKISASHCNRINAYGYKMLPYDVRITDSRDVVFLRHKNEK